MSVARLAEEHLEQLQPVRAERAIGGPVPLDVRPEPADGVRMVAAAAAGGIAVLSLVVAIVVTGLW